MKATLRGLTHVRSKTPAERPKIKLAKTGGIHTRPIRSDCADLEAALPPDRFASMLIVVVHRCALPFGSDGTIMPYEMPLGGGIHRISSLRIILNVKCGERWYLFGRDNRLPPMFHSGKMPV